MSKTTTKQTRTLGSQPQAYAHVVKQLFYNTRHLAKVDSYVGFR